MIESVFPCLSAITKHFLWLSFFQVSLNSSLNKPSWHPYLVTSWQENVLLAFKVIGFILPTYWQWIGGDCSQSSLILLCTLYSIFYSILWIRMSPIAIIATLLSLIPGCRESVLYEAISQCKEPGFLSLSLALRSFLLVFLLFSICRWDSDSGSDRSRWDINSILCLTLTSHFAMLSATPTAERDPQPLSCIWLLKISHEPQDSIRTSRVDFSDLRVDLSIWNLRVVSGSFGATIAKDAEAQAG